MSSPPTVAAAAFVRGGETVCLGSSSTLQADLTGTAPWTLVWSDGVAQSVSTSPATRVVKPTVTTTYTLTSFRDAAGEGTISGSAVVAVKQPASIASQPRSRTIKRRGIVTLSVTATGASPLSYQWYRGSSGNTSPLVGTNSSSYRTPRLSTTTSYWVRVRNDCGAVDSATATIMVR